MFIDTAEAYEALEDKTNVLGLFTNDPMISNLNAMADGIEANEKAIAEEAKTARAAEANRVSKTEYFDIIPEQNIKDTFNPSFNDGDCARAYVVARDTNGKSREDSILVSKYIKGHSLALRDQSGRLFTGKAEDKNHCVNKDYVDTLKSDLVGGTITVHKASSAIQSNSVLVNDTFVRYNSTCEGFPVYSLVQYKLYVITFVINQRTQTVIYHHVGGNQVHYSSTLSIDGYYVSYFNDAEFRIYKSNHTLVTDVESIHFRSI